MQETSSTKFEATKMKTIKASNIQKFMHLGSVDRAFEACPEWKKARTRNYYPPDSVRFFCCRRDTL
jgi:hypothetical protein